MGGQPMNYKKIDRDFAYKRMYDLTRKECPGKPEEFYKLIAEQRTKEGIRLTLKRYISKKLQERDRCNYRFADERANGIIDDLPEELFPNIEEWLCDEPISEIDYGGMSIKRIMEQHKELLGITYGFLQCIDIMKEYIKNDCKDKGICYESFIRYDKF